MNNQIEYQEEHKIFLEQLKELAIKENEFNLKKQQILKNNSEIRIKLDSVEQECKRIKNESEIIALAVKNEYKPKLDQA